MRVGVGLAIGALSASHYDWYVDSVNGSDDNAGTFAAPFATIAKLLTVWEAGQSVGLAKGSTWREQMDVPTGAGSSVDAYGSGNRPIIDAANIVAGGAWSKTGGRTNVYETAVTPLWGSANHLGMWENGAYLMRAANLGECDSTPGSYYPSGASGAITLYVHPKSSTDPTSDGKTYEYSHRQHGVNAYDADHFTIQGVHTKHNLHNGGSLRIGQFGHAVDCAATHNGTYGIFCRTGARLDNCTVTGCYHSGATSALVHLNDNTPNSEGFGMYNCTLSCASIPVPGWWTTVGYTSHYNTSGDFGTVHIEGTTFDTIQYGVIDPRHTSTVELVGNIFTNCKYNSVSPSEGSGVTVLIDGGSWSSNIPDQRAFIVDYDTATVTFQNLTITTAERTDIGYIAVRAGADVTIQDCDFVNSFADNARIPIYCNNAGADLTLQGNVFSGPNNWTDIYSFDAGASGMTWASDNNTFGPNFSMSIFGTSYAVLATYQTGTEQDAHSLVDS